ncbi:MAG: hypothetical protein WCG04_04525 [Alphaproteobacteria bacterium]
MMKNTSRFLVSAALALTLVATTAHAAPVTTKTRPDTVTTTAHADTAKTEEKASTEEASNKAEAASEALAPTLKISGFTSVNFWGVNQSNRLNGKGAGYHLANDLSDLYFIVSGRSESGLGYRYQMTFEALPGAGKLYITQNFIELQKGATVQLGAAPDVTRSILQDGSRLMGGTGGFSGLYSRVFNVSSGVFSGFRPLGETKYATKIVVFSPEWEGIRLAFDFTPNTAHFGAEPLNTAGTGTISSPGNTSSIYTSNNNGPFGVHSMSFGMSYNRAMGDWNVKMSAVGLLDRSYVVNTTKSTYSRTRVRGVRSYQLGGILGYGKFQVGGGWLDNGRSRLPYDNKLSIGGVSLGDTWQGNSGKAWNMAANYTDGPYQFAVGHQKTFRKTDAVNKAIGNVTSATFGITPLQGLKLYVESDYVKTATNTKSVALASAIHAQTASQLTNGIGNNKGVVTLTGIALSF